VTHREAPEVAERRVGVGVGVVARAADEPVDPVGVGPVGLHGHRREPALGDQALRDLGALAVELVRPVGCLAEKDVAARSISAL
jgi:hypothetical protein